MNTKSITLYCRGCKRFWEDEKKRRKCPQCASKEVFAILDGLDVYFALLHRDEPHLYSVRRLQYFIEDIFNLPKLSMMVLPSKLSRAVETFEKEKKEREKACKNLCPS
jgi:hypothetical protein